MIRHLLTLSLVLSALTVFGQDQFEARRGSRVSWARLKFPVFGSSGYESTWDWHNHPSGDVRLIDQIRRKTSVNLKQEWNVVSLEDLDEMIAFPFIFVHGQRRANFTPKMNSNFKEYLLRGGFMFIDDCVYTNRQPDAFYLSIIEKFRVLLPDVEIKRLPNGHDLFQCFYRFQRPVHVQGRDNGISAVYYQKRLIAIMTSSDYHCAWLDNGWFNARITQAAYEVTLNIYIYVMTH